MNISKHVMQRFPDNQQRACISFQVHRKGPLGSGKELSCVGLGGFRLADVENTYFFATFVQPIRWFTSYY